MICVSTTPDLATTKRPLADAAGIMLGSFGIALITLGATMSILGNFAAAVLAAPRMTYALAREGSLPALFARVHPRTRTPHVSIALYATLGFVLGAAGGFAELAVMSSIARLIGYMACVAALFPLARRFGQSPGALRLPGGAAIPCAAFVVCLWLLAQAEYDALLHTGLLILVGSVLYAATRLSRRRTKS
jgi:amino acid transporter